MKQQAVLWRWLDGSGMEHCRMCEEAAEPALTGGVVVSHDEVPWQIEYEVRCDNLWRTRAVTIRAHAGVMPRELTLEVDAHDVSGIACEHVVHDNEDS